MLATKYFQLKKEMCNVYQDCQGCPFEYTDCVEEENQNPVETVKIVENWATTHHPMKTTMTAVECISEWNRLCSIYHDNNCEKCPFNEVYGFIGCVELLQNDPDYAVAIIEQWSGLNP